MEGLQSYAVVVAQSLVLWFSIAVLVFADAEAKVTLGHVKITLYNDVHVYLQLCTLHEEVSFPVWVLSGLLNEFPILVVHLREGRA